MPHSFPRENKKNRESSRRRSTPHNLEAAIDAMNEVNTSCSSEACQSCELLGKFSSCSSEVCTIFFELYVQSVVAAEPSIPVYHQGRGSAKHYLPNQETGASKETGSRSKRSRSVVAERLNETDASSSHYIDASLHDNQAADDSMALDTSGVPGKEEVLAAFWQTKRELDYSSWAVESPNSSVILDPNSSLTAPSDVSLVVPRSVHPDTSHVREGLLDETLSADEVRNSRRLTRDDDVASVSASWDNRSSVIERTPSRGHSTTPPSSPKSDLKDEKWQELDELNTSLNLEPDSNRTIASGTDVTLADGRISKYTKGFFEELAGENEVEKLRDEVEDKERSVTPDFEASAFIPETPFPKNRAASRSNVSGELEGSDISLNLEPPSHLIIAGDLDITLIHTPDTSLDGNDSFEMTLQEKPVDKSSLDKTRSTKKRSHVKKKVLTDQENSPLKHGRSSCLNLLNE